MLIFSHNLSLLLTQKHPKPLHSKSHLFLYSSNHSSKHYNNFISLKSQVLNHCLGPSLHIPPLIKSCPYIKNKCHVLYILQSWCQKFHQTTKRGLFILFTILSIYSHSIIQSFLLIHDITDIAY